MTCRIPRSLRWPRCARALESLSWESSLSTTLGCFNAVFRCTPIMGVTGKATHKLRCVWLRTSMLSLLGMATPPWCMHSSKAPSRRPQRIANGSWVGCRGSWKKVWWGKHLEKIGWMQSRDLSCHALSHLVNRIVYSCLAQAWWDNSMTMTYRLLNCFFAWHFLEGTRVISSNRRDRSTPSFMHQNSYRCISRAAVHMVLRCASWPSNLPRISGKEQMEWKAEHQFAFRRAQAKSGQLGVRDYGLATQRVHQSQATKAKESPPPPWKPCREPCVEGAVLEKANTLARSAAMSLLGLCCPKRFPANAKEFKSPAAVLETEYRLCCEMQQH